MQNDKLLNCPFCGSDRLYIAEHNYFGRKFATVNCIECHISQTGDGFETREEAIEQWNTRKPMERIVERLDQLEDDANTEYRAAKVGQAERSMDYYDGLEEAYRNAKYLVSNGGKE